MSGKDEALAGILTAAPVVPVLTIEDRAMAVPLARALVAGGLTALEVTLRTAAGLDCIRAIRDEVEGCNVGAGTVLDARQVDDAVRATLLSAVSQDGTELIPKGSTLHGKVIDVQSASKQKPIGRLVLEFNVIEHFETHSLATIQTRSVPFEAALEPKEKFRDVRVDSGEELTLTLAIPLRRASHPSTPSSTAIVAPMAVAAAATRTCAGSPMKPTSSAMSIARKVVT